MSFQWEGNCTNSFVFFSGLGPAPRFFTKLRNSNISDENVNPACDKFKQPFNNGKNHGR